MLDKKQVWHDCLESVKVSVSSAIFSTWFSQTHLVEIKDLGERFYIEVGCPSTFIKNTVEVRYFGLIQDSLSKSLAKPCDLIFTVKENPDVFIDKKGEAIPLFDQDSRKDKDFLGIIIASRLRLTFTFENFAVSSANQMAHAAAEAIVKEPGTAYNPLFIWGGVGVGKTHLMSAVGYEILKKDGDKKVFLCTGEEFTNDIVEGIRNKTTQAFRNKYRKLDALLIDDIQFIGGKDAVQEEFFHTFNAIVAAGGQVILTSDKPPVEIPKIEERLRSRFEAGLIVDIAPPDFELRCAIIQIKARERGIEMPMDIVQIIASNINSARKIEGFLIRLISEVKLKKEVSFNEELITSLLGKGIETNGKEKKVLPNQILEAVSKHYSIGKRALLGKSRSQSIALPRQILMYVIRTQLGIPLKEIGRIIGGRDHTTVIHAVEKITGLTSSNVQIREDIMRIKNSL